MKKTAGSRRILVAAMAAAAAISSHAHLLMGEDEVCVRGVEIAAVRPTQNLFLANMTSCRFASLLVLRQEHGAAPLDEAASAAVFKADALLVHGVDASIAFLYGKLLRGAAHVIVPSHDVEPAAADFDFVKSAEGFSWYRRRSGVAGGAAGMRVEIESPNDGEVFAFESEFASIRLRIRAPPASLLSLLPLPRLQVTADPASLTLPLKASSRTVELTLDNVTPGSHLITIGLAYGEDSMVPDASTSTMIDVVPNDLVQRQRRRRVATTDETLGCARATTPAVAPPSATSSNGDHQEQKRLRVAFLDLFPKATIDGQRRVWIQRCGHWARSSERTRFDLSYLLLYDDVVAPLSENAPSRRAVEDAGVKASIVAAPWRTGSSGIDARKKSLQAARLCARGDATDASDLNANQRAWVSFLSSSVDVLLMHAAPGLSGGPVGDAARLSCLGRLAAIAGVGARFVELPTLPSADLLTWSGSQRKKSEELVSTIDGDITVQPQRQRVGWADALIVPSHYAATATSRAVERGGGGDGSLRTRSTPVVVLQPGVDEQWFRAGAASRARRARSTEAEEKKVAVWVGRLDVDKSPLLFVRACAILAASAHDRTECVVVGEGPLRAPLAARAFGLRTNDTVRTRFIGSRHDADGLADVVANADVLVSTSVFPETFGLASLEAAAAGVPVVAFGVAGTAEHVCDGVNALVPDAPTPTALASAMRQLLENASRARELGDAGAVGAKAHFGAKAAAERAALFVRRTHSVLASQDARCRRRIALATAGENVTMSSLCDQRRPILSPIYDDNSFLADVGVVGNSPPLFPSVGSAAALEERLPLLSASSSSSSL